MGFVCFVLAGKAEDPLFPSFFGGWAQKKLPFLHFLFWQLVLLLATLTVHRVSCDSVTHDG
jgi:hypothetical protein